MGVLRQRRNHKVCLNLKKWRKWKLLENLLVKHYNQRWIFMQRKIQVHWPKTGELKQKGPIIKDNIQMIKIKMVKIKKAMKINVRTSYESLQMNSNLKTKEDKVSYLIYIKSFNHSISFKVKRNEIAGRYKARVTNFLKEMAEGPV